MPTNCAVRDLDLGGKGCGKDVSVVIPFYNDHDLVWDAVKSVFSNKHILEVVIVEDLDSYPPLKPNRNFDVTIIKNSTGSKGAGVCRSLGYTICKGEFVAFLDSDDLWEPWKVESQRSSMIRESFVFSFHGYIDVNGKKTVRKTLPQGPFNLDGFLKKSFIIGCSTVMLRKTKIESIIPTNLLRRNDYRAWFDVIGQCERENLGWGLAGTGVLSMRRLQENSLSSSKPKSFISQLQFYLDCGFGFIHSIYYMIFYVKNGIRDRFYD